MYRIIFILLIVNYVQYSIFYGFPFVFPNYMFNSTHVLNEFQSVGVG